MEESFLNKSEWLEEVFNKHSDALLRYAYKLSGSEDRAREATQETFLRLLYERPDKVSGRVASWLFTVCRNIILDRLKKERRMVSRYEEESVRDSAAAVPLDALEAKRSRSTLLGLLDSLPSNQQEVIRLRFQNEFSYREISEITGFSVSNVGFLMHTGLKALRSELEALEQIESAKVGAQ